MPQVKIQKLRLKFLSKHSFQKFQSVANDRAASFWLSKREIKEYRKLNWALALSIVSLSGQLINTIERMAMMYCVCEVFIFSTNTYAIMCHPLSLTYWTLEAFLLNIQRVCVLDQALALCLFHSKFFVWLQTHIPQCKSPMPDLLLVPRDSQHQWHNMMKFWPCGAPVNPWSCWYRIKVPNSRRFYAWRYPQNYYSILTKDRNFVRKPILKRFSSPIRMTSLISLRDMTP
jgi:hypothetical protein